MKVKQWNARKIRICSLLHRTPFSWNKLLVIQATRMSLGSTGALLELLESLTCRVGVCDCMRMSYPISWQTIKHKPPGWLMNRNRDMHLVTSWKLITFATDISAIWVRWKWIIVLVNSVLAKQHKKLPKEFTEQQQTNTAGYFSWDWNNRQPPLNNCTVFNALIFFHLVSLFRRIDVESMFQIDQG